MIEFNRECLEELYKIGGDYLIEQLTNYYFLNYKNFQKEFLQHFENKNNREISELAHKLKSTSAQFGLDRLYAHCVLLESKYQNQQAILDEDIFTVNKLLDSANTVLVNYLAESKKAS